MSVEREETTAHASGPRGRIGRVMVGVSMPGGEVERGVRVARIAVGGAVSDGLAVGVSAPGVPPTGVAVGVGLGATVPVEGGAVEEGSGDAVGVGCEHCAGALDFSHATSASGSTRGENESLSVKRASGWLSRMMLGGKNVFGL